MPTGEIRMSNLPLILTLLSVISIGILGFLEMKKLYTKLNVITNKIDDINENINIVKETPKEQISHEPVQHRVIQQIPPHIQHQMMLRRQQEELHMMRKNESINQAKQEMEDNIIYDENKENIQNNSESEDDIIEVNSDDEINEELIDNDQQDNNDEIIEEKSDDDDDDDDDDDIEIELDNKYNNLSVKELKELCLEKNLKISGNKSKLISRLIENE